MTRFIWTQKALDLWARGVRYDPTPTGRNSADARYLAAHTISAPNIADCYEGFVSQLKPGTPWKLVTE